ncbi:MAG: hypothetical protein JW861_07700 [Bacteroidales bacterium]|nr:hypothetical protein [Bacteroidales bacterium]
MEIIRCKRCLLPSTLSGITFDENGICNHCRKYENDFREWDQIKERKREEFGNILSGAKKLKRPYDCLVPLSGGKDSTYALYLCTKVYKMKTLAVSLDNGFLSGIAKQNIRNALESCNADHMFYTINRENSSRLFKVFTLKTGDFCSGCMRAINYAIELATKSFRIPLVIKGSGRRVQYVSQIKEVTSLNTASYFANVIKGTAAEDDFKHFARYRFSLEFQKIAGGVNDIFGLPRTRLMRFIPQHIGLYDYIYLPFNEIIGILKKEMGWSDGAGSAEHLDCELHDIPFYKDTLRIQNITRHTFHSSGLIRQGLLSREGALLKEEQEIGKENPPAELTKFLQENNITYEEYVNYVQYSDTSRFEPKWQKVARDMYHKFRKF